MKVVRFCAPVLLVLLILGSTLVSAQTPGTTTGTISGRVTDNKGASLPGVLVTATGPTGAKTSTTDAGGRYTIAFLTPGVYTLRAELQGFTPIEQGEVNVRLTQRTEVDFKMVTGTQETVEVSGAAPAVDVQSTTTGATMTSDLLANIPVGRSIAAPIALAPGSTNSGVGGGNLSISGASGLENTYVVDGVNITDPGYGAIGSYSIVYGSLGTGFTSDMVKEVQVKSGGFEPEYGEALGGVVNVITKSGGNNFSGEGYTYFQPRALEADRRQVTNFVSELFVNPDNEQSVDGGVNFSGPVIHDRLFFFGAYNPRRTYDKFLNDVQAPAFSQFPSATRVRTTQAYAVKATGNLTANHNFEFSAFGDPSTGKLGFQDGGAFTSGLQAENPLLNESSLEYGSNSQIGRWTGILSPSMFIEGQVARAANKFTNIIGPQGNIYELLDETGATVINRGGIGFFDAGSKGRNLQYHVKATNIFGGHELRYGVEFQNINYAGGANYTGPTYTAFNGQQTTTGAIVAMINGSDASSSLCPQCAHIPVVFATLRNRLSPNLIPTTTQYLDWFAQDSWNVTDYLNVKAGIRWERQHMKSDLSGSESFTFSNNWAPRVGASYDYLRNGKSKVFFHWGRFFEKVPNDLAVRALTSEVSSSGYYYDAALSRPIPGTGVISGSQPEQIEGITSNNHSPIKTKAQYSDEWVAGAEQEVFYGVTLGARGIYRNVNRVVEDMQIDLSQPCLFNVPGYPATYCVQPGMTYENFLFDSSSYFLTNMDGHYPGFPAFVRKYKALELTAERRISGNWQLIGSYRYAQLTGNYEGLFRRDNGQSDPNLTSLGDFAQSPGIGYTFAIGPLTNDNRHIGKVFAAHQWNWGLNAGFGFNITSGTPVTNLGAIPFYGADERLLSPRGAFGRTPTTTTFDMHLAYGLKAGPGHVDFGMDVFNLFNQRKALDLHQASQIDNRTYNPVPDLDFLKAQLFQDPRTFRFLAKYSF